MPKQPISLFFSYSHADERFRKQLQKHFALLKRQGFLSEWHDRKILAGEEWKGQIDTQLGTAGVILLLVSSNFMASDYCYDVEMKRAMERHVAGEARVIPIILSSVDWHGAPFSKLQALPDGAKPITEWPSREKAFANVAQGIRLVIEELSAEFKELQSLSLQGQQLRSGAGDPAKVRFINSSGQTVQIFWLNFNGERVLYKILEPGQRYIQATYSSHPWLITSSDGQELALYLPEPGYNDAVIGKQSGA